MIFFVSSFLNSIYANVSSFGLCSSYIIFILRGYSFFKRLTIQNFIKYIFKVQKKDTSFRFLEDLKWIRKVSRIPWRLIQYTNIRNINFYVNPDSLSILNVIYEFLITSIIGSIRGYKTIKGKDEIRKNRERERGRRNVWIGASDTYTRSPHPFYSISSNFLFFFFFTRFASRLSFLVSIKYAKSPAESWRPLSPPTLLFTNYECCKTEHNDRDQAGPIFAALSTISLMRVRGPPCRLRACPRNS